MDWSVSNPASFRVNNVAVGAVGEWSANDVQLVTFKKHESHPSLGHLTLLVFEAVLQVVCVSLPGYITARMGHFDADKQKFLANLNVQIFTPCLIFTKLASQLNAGALAELAVIPMIFVIQTAVSYVVALVVAKICRLKKRPANFVTAMAVFGNSNSLPISLVISLSQTLKGLHWDRVPGDNNEEVAARGILYLMIFQQLGQLVRWTWGYNVLLAPKKPESDDNNTRTLEEGSHNGEGLLGYDSDDGERRSSDEWAGRTPVAGTSRASPNESEDEEESMLIKKRRSPNRRLSATKNGPFVLPHSEPGEEIMSFPRVHDLGESDAPGGIRGLSRRMSARIRSGFRRAGGAVRRRIVQISQRAFVALPSPIQTALAATGAVLLRFLKGLWEFMNPPLWAMLFAIVVASVPELQRLFFQKGTFVNNSVTSALRSSAGVAVPLILVVLGANLARNTQNQDTKDPEEEQIGTRLLVASLISRMLLPTLLMAPILAVVAKFVPVSILDDPIFIVVCFLLSGAPSALQLAQICQLNEVYEQVMSKILFHSYVIW